MTEYRPLTPDLRQKIFDSLDSREKELKTCKVTAYTSFFLAQIQSQRKLFKMLPDGYPIPIEK